MRLLQEQQLRDEKPAGALSWYLNRERDHLKPDGSLTPRRLWSNDLICPPKMEPIMRELCSSFDYGHLHPDCPADKIGKFRLDGDGAHWIGPYDPHHSPDPDTDFPPETAPRPSGSPYPGMALWSPHGIIQDGLHGGPPLYHFSCLYELQPIAEGEGGFGCIAGSHHPDALVGPDRTSPLGAGHVPWGKPPWPPHVDSDITKVRGQPGDCGTSQNMCPVTRNHRIFATRIVDLDLALRTLSSVPQCFSPSVSSTQLFHGLGRGSVVHYL